MLIALVIQKNHPLRHRVLTRLAAKSIDLAIVLVVGAVVFYPFGPIFGFLYSILADAMSFGPFEGQSIGKKLMKIRVIHKQTRGPATIRDSALRNAPIGVATFFAIIPVWGWILSPLIGFPLMIMELYLMLATETGCRLGDVMGDTEVIEVSHVPKTS